MDFGSHFKKNYAVLYALMPCLVYKNINYHVVSRYIFVKEAAGENQTQRSGQSLHLGRVSLLTITGYCTISLLYNK